VSADDRRASLDTLREMNALHRSDTGDPEIDTRIASYEMAFRMQTSVPELTDVSQEPESVKAMYGVEPGKRSFANNCLLARRLVERGVRFVQLYHRGWDNHGTGKGDDIVNRLPALCREVDQAGAALVKDLKQRGLLDSTVVVWGGEFGRTPMNEGRNNSKFLGRDHHPRAFSIWMAGGGIKGGTTVGSTDELGYNPGGRSRGRPRPARHGAPPPGPRPHGADLQVPGTGLPPHRRPRQRRPAAPGLTAMRGGRGR
jgi:hypothetical protein